MSALASTQARVGIALAAVGFTTAALGSLLVLLARDLDVDPQQLSLLSSAFGGGLLAVAVTGTRLLTRGPDPVLRGGALLLAGGAILLALAQDTGPVMLGALAAGLGTATLVLAVSAQLTGPGAVRRRAAGNAAASIAGVLAPLALSALDATAEAGRIALLLLLPPLLLLISVPARHTTHEPASASSDLLDRGEVARRWSRVVLAVSAEFCFVVWAVTRLQLTGLTPASAVAAATAFPLGMALGRTAGLRLSTVPNVLPLSALISALGTAAVVLGEQTPLVAAGLFTAGLGVALLYPVTLAHLLASPGLSPAAGASAGALATGTAVLLAPLTLATIATTINLRLAFLLVLLPLTLIARRPRPVKSAPCKPGQQATSPRGPA